MRTATREFVEMSAEEGRLPYLPALDGLRGVAVAGVLAFHAGLDHMVGGYLGVSTFFTLSGFLITSLLLGEATATGGVGLATFWSRRLRRLLPASLLTLAGVLLVFIISLGYYITPALVGGPKDQMLSFFIAFNTNVTVNWGLAAALSVVLLSLVILFFAIYNRLVGVDNLKLS